MKNTLWGSSKEPPQRFAIDFSSVKYEFERRDMGSREIFRYLRPRMDVSLTGKLRDLGFCLNLG